MIAVHRVRTTASRAHSGRAVGLLALGAFIFASRLHTAPHRYDHVVIVIEENHSFTQIIGNTTDAPYLNQLANEGVNFTNFFAITHPIEAWQQEQFGADAGQPHTEAAADADADGADNLLEYALASDPLEADSISLPNAVPDADFLTLAFVRSTTSTDTTYVVQVSDILSAWEDGCNYFASGAPAVQRNTVTTEVSRVAQDSGTEVITVRDNKSRAAAARRFMRLTVIKG
jgi:hypothetical protein